MCCAHDFWAASQQMKQASLQMLGYKKSRNALTAHVDGEDRKDGVTIRDSIGRDQEVTFINESGLY